MEREDKRMMIEYCDCHSRGLLLLYYPKRKKKKKSARIDLILMTAARQQMTRPSSAEFIT